MERPCSSRHGCLPRLLQTTLDLLQSLNYEVVRGFKRALHELFRVRQHVYDNHMQPRSSGCRVLARPMRPMTPTPPPSGPSDSAVDLTIAPNRASWRARPAALKLLARLFQSRLSLGRPGQPQVRLAYVSWTRTLAWVGASPCASPHHHYHHQLGQWHLMATPTTAVALHGISVVFSCSNFFWSIFISSWCNMHF